MTTHRIDLPWTKPPLSGNRGRNDQYAYAAAVRKAMWAAQEAVRSANLPALTGANITLHMRPATRQRRDADNLAPTYKVVQDALVKEGVIPDDSWVHVPTAAQTIHPPEPGQPAELWVTLEELGRLP